ncbi:MAG: NAD(+)/NADH kinase [Acidobacteriaceae bacterium]
MRKVAIISKPQKPELKIILAELVDWLQCHGLTPILEPACGSYPGVEYLAADRSEMASLAPELVVCLGGDGTLLSAARSFASTTTPILAVNLGSLGFLTEVPIADFYATMEAWIAGRAVINTRRLMHAQLFRQGEFVREWEALNDVVLSKGAIARMGEFAIELDGQFVARFRADGVIVSTPTGSTAYNLAANGPILTPGVNAMILSAICPHLLTIRPIVFPGDTEVAVVVDVIPQEMYLTVDGQEAVELALNDRILCRRSNREVHLLSLHPDGFFNVLRSKLHWGER